MIKEYFTKVKKKVYDVRTKMISTFKMIRANFREKKIEK